MTRNFMSAAVTVFVKDGTTYIMAPSGEVLGALQNVTLTDNYDDVAKVTATFICNVAGSELEANALYKSAKLNELTEELAKQDKKFGPPSDGPKHGIGYACAISIGGTMFSGCIVNRDWFDGWHYLFRPDCATLVDRWVAEKYIHR